MESKNFKIRSFELLIPTLYIYTHVCGKKLSCPGPHPEQPLLLVSIHWLVFWNNCMSEELQLAQFFSQEHNFPFNWSNETNKNLFGFNLKNSFLSYKFVSHFFHDFCIKDFFPCSPLVYDFTSTLNLSLFKVYLLFFLWATLCSMWDLIPHQINQPMLLAEP